MKKPPKAVIQCLVEQEDSDAEVIATESVTLNRIAFAAKLMMERELARGGKHTAEFLLDFITQKYALEMRSWYYGQARDYDLKPVPVTWWDHFKRDAIPTFTQWLRLRVNLRRETIKAVTIYPDVPQIQGGRYYYTEIGRNEKRQPLDNGPRRT